MSEYSEQFEKIYTSHLWEHEFTSDYSSGSYSYPISGISTTSDSFMIAGYIYGKGGGTNISNRKGLTGDSVINIRNMSTSLIYIYLYTNQNKTNAAVTLRMSTSAFKLRYLYINSEKKMYYTIDDFETVNSYTADFSSITEYTLSATTSYNRIYASSYVYMTDESGRYIIDRDNKFIIDADETESDSIPNRSDIVENYNINDFLDIITNNDKFIKLL